jgi:D-alanine-D-alanine ligase
LTAIVLFGGISDERHVSVATGQSLVRALDSPLAWFWAPDGAVHDVSPAELLAHQRPFEIDYVPSRAAIWPDLEQALDTLPVDDPVFVLALHGTAGEDGTVQRMMERRAIPFTGSGSEASAAAFDKQRAKSKVRTRMADERVTSNEGEVATAVKDMLSRHQRIVLKPLAGGSSRGLMFLDRDSDAAAVIAKIAAQRIPYIIEQFIDGRELTVGVIDEGNGPLALPVIEIQVDPGQTFDYLGKYLGQGTREICPADIPEAMAREAQHVALNAHLALGCSGYSRTDIIANDEGAWFLELNTLPGLTSSSLVPQELKAAGIDFRVFVKTQIELARRLTSQR